MRQQINLYQPATSSDRSTLSATSVVIALGVIAVSLAGVTWYANQRVTQLEQAVAALRTRQTSQQQQLEQSSSLLAARTTPATLEARVKELGLSVEERERALQLLQSGQAGQTKGFAARMEALARRHVAGLWLDSVQLSGTSPTMSLQGATTNPAIVPAYLQSLADETVLAGTRFDQFLIQGPSDKDVAERGARTLRFSAGSTALPAVKEPSS